MDIRLDAYFYCDVGFVVILIVVGNVNLVFRSWFEAYDNMYVKSDVRAVKDFNRWCRCGSCAFF